MVGDSFRWRRLLVVWNSKARNGVQRDAVLAALELLREQGLEVAEDEPSSAEHAARLAEEASADTLVAAAGGDGTVHAVAQGLIRRRLGMSATHPGGGITALEGPGLGIIPLGTSNDLARSLKIPLEPMEAVATVARAAIVPIDAVHVASAACPQWMVNVAAGGNTAEVTRRLTAEQKQLWGPWAYVRGVLEVAVDMQNYPITVSLDDQPPLEFNAFNVIVANGRTAATLEVAGRADLQDGLLEVVVVKEHTLVQTAGVATQFFAGDYLESEQVFYRRARRVRLKCDQAMPFSIDGEVCSGGSWDFTVQPAALAAAVGDDFAARRG